MHPTLTPYLMFNGHCAEAMKFYQSVLGGKLTIRTYGEAMGEHASPEMKNRVMHASLEHELLSFMASDGAIGEITFGNNVRLSIVGTDEAKLRGFFAQLSKDGKVSMPLEKQAWGDFYGAFTDKFGIHWMIDIPPAK